MAHQYNTLEVLELVLIVWVVGPVIVLIWLTGPALLNLLRRLPVSYQHYAHTRQRSPNWRPNMKQILYIALTLVIFGGFFTWSGKLLPDSTSPEESSTTGEYAFIGHRITNPAGTDLGIVKNIIVNKDGHPIYVIVFFDDPAFYGKAAMIAPKNKIVPIPWEKLTFGPTQAAIMLDADETMLANAPHLDTPSQIIGRNLDAEIQQYWIKANEVEPCCPCRWCPVWWN